MKMFLLLPFPPMELLLHLLRRKWSGPYSDILFVLLIARRLPRPPRRSPYVRMPCKSACAFSSYAMQRTSPETSGGRRYGIPGRRRRRACNSTAKTRSQTGSPAPPRGRRPTRSPRAPKAGPPRSAAQQAADRVEMP